MLLSCPELGTQQKLSEHSDALLLFCAEGFEEIWPRAGTLCPDSSCRPPHGYLPSFGGKTGDSPSSSSIGVTLPELKLLRLAP